MFNFFSSVSKMRQGTLKTAQTRGPKLPESCPINLYSSLVVVVGIVQVFCARGPWFDSVMALIDKEAQSLVVNYVILIILLLILWILYLGVSDLNI